MAAPGKRERSTRKGQYSCDFCRTRKLRCDRPLPCTSCKSRGKTCHFESSPAALKARGSSSVTNTPRQQQHQEPISEMGTQHPLPLASAATTTSSLPSQQPAGSATAILPMPSPQLPSTPSLGGVGPSPSSDIRQVVTHLQRVSMGQSSYHEPVYVADDLVIRVERIRDIPQAPTYTTQLLGKLMPCVWLPHHAEARILLDVYITNLSYIQHVVHNPSLPAAIDDVYRQIDGQEPVKPANVILLLSIIASATHVWAPRDNVDGEPSLFLSTDQANAQTPLWIKATNAVLNSAQNGASLALETVLGIIILSFVVCNLEGVSLRYRSLISTGILLGRELGLHRIDHESNAAAANSLQSEIGRRAWWYLVATDWLLAGRCGGPSEGVYQVHPFHIIVNKPRNINDVDLLDNGFQLALPMSQPTDMSYFLQRIRLAEISRSIVDHNLMGVTSSGRPSYYAHVTAMDFELDQMIHNIPSFLQLDSYESSPDSSKASGIFIQAYLLNSLTHTERCKLHIAYLTSRPSNNPAYASSRDTCLNSARQIIRAEAMLLRSQHSFVQVRLRLGAILYSIFMASIVLLMDICVNNSSSLEDGILHSDVAEALRIIEDTKRYSLAAANLHESLMQILAKYRAQQQQRGEAASRTAAAAGAVINIKMLYVHQRSNLAMLVPPATQLANHNFDRPGPVDSSLDQLSTANIQPSSSLDDPVYFDNAQWEDLFSGISNSSFF